MIRSVLIISLILLTGIALVAQDPGTEVISTVDSLIYDEDHVELFVELSTRDPQRAAVLSAVLPGLGQIYNKQYWKVPLIWGGGVILAHYIRYQDRLYNSFRSALLAESDIDSRTVNPYADFTADILESNVEKLRRDRDNLMIMTVLFYVANIIDAHVSAHLHEFQINDALSLDIQPAFHLSTLNSRSLGISFSLNF